MLNILLTLKSKYYSNLDIMNKSVKFITNIKTEKNDYLCYKMHPASPKAKRTRCVEYQGV